MAAALFRLAAEELAAGDLPAGDLDGTLTVVSAGLLEGGRPAAPEVVKVMVPFGIDLTDHRSTQLIAGAVESADLVLGLERRHGREAVLLDRSALARTFTLKEIVRRGEIVGPRPPGRPLEAWLADLSAGRDRTALIGRSPDDDVVDPLGGDLGAYRATAAELADLARRLASLLWAGPGALRTDAPSADS
jgi:protein-tyrosine-phosphatase